MKPPCEIMVRHILPGLRSAIAKELHEKYRANQSEISKMLGVSQPAVSQYMRHIRGSKMLKNDVVKKKISDVCEKITRNNLSYHDLMKEFCELCVIVRSERLICGLHKNEYRLGDCSFCDKTNPISS